MHDEPTSLCEVPDSLHSRQALINEMVEGFESFQTHRPKATLQVLLTHLDTSKENLEAVKFGECGAYSRVPPHRLLTWTLISNPPP